MTILLIADHNHTQLKDMTRHTLTAALQLKQPIHVLVAGSQCDKAAEEASRLEGVSEVLHVDHECYRHFLSESYSRLIAKLAPNYSHVLASTTSIAKDVLPRAAGLLNMSQVSDIISIIDQETFTRPIYAGNAIATVRSGEKIKFITVRSPAFAAASTSNTAAPISKRPETDLNQKSAYVSAELSSSTRPELTSAKIIVSGGRGLGSADNFKTVLEPLADKLKAAVGASRAAVDAGFVPNDYQVGQTGKIVAPELYIAVGISGAIQHLAGMKDSKVIVAINKDPDAPIFQIATYGLVADLFEAIPEIVKSL